MILPRVTHVALVFLSFSPCLVHSQAPSDDTNHTPPSSIETETGGADWIPAGSVQPEVRRRAVETKARLETRIPSLQREALYSLRKELETGDHQELRIATVPVVIGLLDLDSHVLEFPQDYRVDGPTRLLALEVLAELGGSEARDRIRGSVISDDDSTIRAGAAQLLAERVGADPDADLEVVSRALYLAVRRDGPPSEVSRLLSAARRLVPRVWDPEIPDLLNALIAIHQGSYSASLRREAMSFLELLADL